MKLNIKERLLLLGILPKETNFITLKIIKDLQSSLSFSEEELKIYGFKNENVNGQILTTWDSTKDINKEINIGEKATDLIVEALKKLSDTNKLTMEYFDIYEKFTK